MPDYCSYCQIIGHYALTCRWLHPHNNIKVVKGKKPLHSHKLLVQNGSKKIILKELGRRKLLHKLN